MLQEKVYGVYLIPPPALAYQLGLAHLLLESNFGLVAAGKFMPHCTLFAFLHIKEETSEAELVQAVEEVLQHSKSFPLEFRLETEKFIRLEVAKQPELMNLQARLRQSLWPLLSEYGQNRRLSNNFNPHFTLAYSDLPEDRGTLTQIQDFCQYLYETLPKNNQNGKSVQLIEFQLEAGKSWEDPDYWRTLSWRIIKSFTLPG